VKHFVAILLIVIFLTGCVKNGDEKTLKIVANSWIGYAPLFYAEEKGYLDKIKVKIISVVSLAEAKDIYSIGKADIVATTQHEYHVLKKIDKDIVPILLLDRSNGGDMVLSNRKIEDLKKADKIFAFLEVDSINIDILNDFLKLNHIDKSKIVFKNEDQAQIQTLQYLGVPTLIVTYVPYDYILKKKGYFTVASTKDKNSIIVIDSLCATKKILNSNRKRLIKLKEIIDRSIKEIVKDKNASYKITSPYLDNITYENYINAFKTIKWINNPSNKLLKRIKKLGYSKEDLL